MRETCCRVEYDANNYKIHVNVKEYKPEELVVKTVDNNKIQVCFIYLYLYGLLISFFKGSKRLKQPSLYCLIHFYKRVIMSSEDDQERQKYILTLKR